MSAEGEEEEPSEESVEIESLPSTLPSVLVPVTETVADSGERYSDEEEEEPSPSVVTEREREPEIDEPVIVDKEISSEEDEEVDEPDAYHPRPEVPILVTFPFDRFPTTTEATTTTVAVTPPTTTTTKATTTTEPSTTTTTRSYPITTEPEPDYSDEFEPGLDWKTKPDKVDGNVATIDKPVIVDIPSRPTWPTEPTTTETLEPMTTATATTWLANHTDGYIRYGYPVPGPVGPKGDRGDPGKTVTLVKWAYKAHLVTSL
ncbi:hypothetical protein HDE_04278 [Halotydeus destructor]|nr:hypothetical protein HDE_04278 [Halotydeus destructor]